MVINIAFQRILKYNVWNTMFITAVCVIFLIKLRWPKSKSLKNGLLRPILPRKPRDYTSRDDAIFSGESLLQELSSSWNKLSPENIASSRLVAPEFPRMRPIKRNSNFFSQRERNQLHTVNAYRVPFTCCMLLYQFWLFTSLRCLHLIDTGGNGVKEK